MKILGTSYSAFYWQRNFDNMPILDNRKQMSGKLMDMKIGF